MRLNLGEMTLGDILDQSVRLLTSKLGLFYAINLIVMSPVLLFNLLLPAVGLGIAATDQVAALVGVLGVALLSIVLQSLANACTLAVVAQAYQDKSITIGDALAYGMNRLVPLIITSIIVGLVVCVGLIFCIVPGIIFFTMFAVSSQVVVVERLSAMDAITRSQNLTSGNRGRVFGLTILVFILIILVSMVAGLVGAVLPAVEVVPNAGAKADPTNPFAALANAKVEVNYVNHAIGQIVSFLIQVVANSFWAIAFTILYFDLRNRKEGTDLLSMIGGSTGIKRGSEQEWES